MSLILLRHTRPDVAEGVCYGRTDLLPAEDFVTVASAVIAGLPDVSRVVTSPLVRCARLAERIAAARDLDPETDPRIVEMDFGSWERTPWDAIPRDELNAWAADFHGARPHGGESVAMLAARVGAAADKDEILVSGSVLGAAGSTRFTLSEPRSVTLKGVREPVEVRSVDWR